MNRLLSNVFNSVREINRLRKEINRLLSKGMSNFYVKVTIELFSKLCHQVSFGELQLMEISLNFKASSCNLEIRCL